MLQTVDVGRLSLAAYRGIAPDVIACCVPMLLIAVFLLASGIGLAALIPFVFCAAMMVVMMRAMGDGRR